MSEYVFIWLVLLLNFGLQFYLVLFCLLKSWSYDRRLKQTLKIPPSTEKLPATVACSITQPPEDLKNAKPPTYSRYDMGVAQTDVLLPDDAWPCPDPPYTPFAWDLVQR